MDWFYLPMLQMHELLGWFVVALFLVRGLAAQFGAEWAMDDRLRTLAFGAHFLLLISGLSMWGLLQHDPLRESWLMAKLLALAAYLACGHWALGKGRFHLPAYLLALLLLAYVVGLSITRETWLGL